jgi:hypothetical protein
VALDTQHARRRLRDHDLRDRTDCGDVLRQDRAVGGPRAGRAVGVSEPGRFLVHCVFDLHISL